MDYSKLKAELHDLGIFSNRPVPEILQPADVASIPSFDDMMGDFELFKQEYMDPTFSQYVRNRIFGIKATTCKLQVKFKNVRDFIDRGGTLQLRKFYRDYWLNHAKGEVNFEPASWSELRYCILNGITDRPRCKTCGKECEFVSDYYGYRDYCSITCQLYNNNSIKESKLSDLNDDAIRELLLSISPDVRNRCNEDVANVFINIENYSRSFGMDLSDREKIYIFLMRLTPDDIMCPYCKTHKRKFISQVAGYRKTCGRYLCATCASRGVMPRDSSKTNEPFHPKFETITDSFLYVLKFSSGVYKIGISCNPKARAKKLSKSYGDYTIIMCVYVKETAKLENELHDHFRNQRVNPDFNHDGYSELFNLSDDDIKWIKNRLFEAM